MFTDRRCEVITDHPRIRGEHGWPAHHIKSTMGSSPHTRGAPLPGAVAVLLSRIIPAYAGSTTDRFRLCGYRTDHPRIRGEHLAERLAGHVGEGSSPHTRGARKRRSDGGILGRIIPAYAGSTAKSTSSAWRGSDHPRIRGEHQDPTEPSQENIGSSPHTRGALPKHQIRITSEGIIPAYAGSTVTTRTT